MRSAQPTCPRAVTASAPPRQAPAGGLVRAAETRLPTPHGEFQLVAYRDPVTGQEPLAFIGGRPPVAGAHVRIHVECPVAGTLRSTRCDCAAHLAHALAATSATGGVLIFLRATPGNLLDRLAGYARQDLLGRDGVAPCSQIPPGYEIPAAILHDLTLDDVVVHSADPRATAALRAHAVRVAG